MALPKFKTIRVLFLLIILLIVALYTSEQKRASTSWYKTLEIVIYPINAENNKVIGNYIDRLKDNNFALIDKFIAEQSSKYNLILSKPTKTRLGKEITILPPIAPKPDSGILSNISWSIKFRYWAWKNTPDDQSNLRRARIFVLYHQVSDGRQLAHSYGLNKGLLGYVNAFASKEQQGQNNIVIAHEFLHTLGASDKYGLNGEPIFPSGFASPNKENPYDQNKAEIMAGRIPVSATASKMPKSLKWCVIGKETAMEINWIKP
ncbi:MAG: hypothetical protein AB8D52_07745 [Gammaproteobacteria bacterium]